MTQTMTANSSVTATSQSWDPAVLAVKALLPVGPEALVLVHGLLGRHLDLARLPHLVADAQCNGVGVHEVVVQGGQDLRPAGASRLHLAPALGQQLLQQVLVLNGVTLAHSLGDAPDHAVGCDRVRLPAEEIGRASCRERVLVWGVAVAM